MFINNMICSSSMFVEEPGGENVQGGGAYTNQRTTLRYLQQRYAQGFLTIGEFAVHAPYGQFS